MLKPTMRQKSTQFRISRAAWVLLSLSICPYVLGRLGVQFGSPKDLGPTLHLLLEWTSVMFAFGIGIIAYAQYRITRDPIVIIFGTAFLCSGLMDGFHALAAAKLIHGAADSSNFVPFTWALSRMFNALIVLLGALLLLHRPKTVAVENAKSVLTSAVVLLTFACATILFCATSTNLPQTQFPNAVITRPWDVAPLIVYLLTGVFVLRRLADRHPCGFTRSLILVLFVELAIELHMAFGSYALFDHHFNVAHGLKIVAYVIPLLGLLADYVMVYKRQEELTVEVVRASHFNEAVVASATDGIISTDASGTIFGVNPAVERYFGYPSSQLVGRNIEMLIAEESAHDISSYRDRVLASTADNAASCMRDDISARNVDGTSIPMHVSIVSTDNREQRALVYTFTDLSELIEHQEQTKKSDQRLRFLVNELTQGVLFTDVNGLITSWNRGASEIFGHSSSEAMNMSFSELLPEHLRAQGDQLIKSAVAGQKSFETETFGLRRSNQEFPVHISVSTWSINGVIAIGALIRDETDRKDVEERLREAKVSAERASKSKSSFLANMSHELRTPLNGIAGMAQLLQRTQLAAEQTTYVDVLLGSTEALTVIINDILDFSKIEAGELHLEAIAFDPKSVVHQVVDLVKLGNRNTDVEFRVKIADDIVTAVIGDPYRIRQILLNLLSNAAKFTKKGSITVSLASSIGDDSAVQLNFKVEDTGMGISPQARERMFSPFEQEDISVTRKYGGTGLGLTICRQLATMMGGEICCDALYSGGSCFLFHVTCEPSAALTKPSVVAKDNAPFTGKILVAEDNKVNQLVVRGMLKKLGYEFEIVENGKLAFEAVEKGGYTVILMDCQMPVMGGLEATRRIRATQWGKEIPIIAMTAQALSKDRQACLDAGMSDYLTKPVNITKLAETLGLCRPTEIRCDGPDSADIAV